MSAPRRIGDAPGDGGRAGLFFEPAGEIVLVGETSRLRCVAHKVLLSQKALGPMQTNLSGEASKAQPGLLPNEPVEVVAVVTERRREGLWRRRRVGLERFLNLVKHGHRRMAHGTRMPSRGLGNRSEESQSGCRTANPVGRARLVCNAGQIRKQGADARDLYGGKVFDGRSRRPLRAEIQHETERSLARAAMEGVGNTRRNDYERARADRMVHICDFLRALPRKINEGLPVPVRMGAEVGRFGQVAMKLEAHDCHVIRGGIQVRPQHGAKRLLSH